MNDQLKQAIIDGNADVATALTTALIATGATAREILDSALLPGMEVVGMSALLTTTLPHMAADDRGRRRPPHGAAAGGGAGPWSIS